MLIKESYADVQTSANGKETSMSECAPPQELLDEVIGRLSLPFAHSVEQGSLSSILQLLDIQMRELPGVCQGWVVRGSKSASPL
jgi:hypothetical protein